MKQIHTQVNTIKTRKNKTYPEKDNLMAKQETGQIETNEKFL